MSLSRRRLATTISGVSALALAASGLALAQPALLSQASAETSGADCLAAATHTSGAAQLDRQRAFAAAARTYGVPSDVLLGVSYMESRWDDYGAKPSTTGGYGPMHLTNVKLPDMSQAKGDGTTVAVDASETLRTAHRAADLTGLSVARLTSDDAANICGGAALLASYQRELAKPTGAASTVADWYDAVARYSWAPDAKAQATFADRVFATIKNGASRTTNDGQRLRLDAHPALKVPAARDASRMAPARSNIHCPEVLNCEWIPAPYEQYGPTVSDYGNHDLADRPRDLSIDYIIIHDTETSYDGTIALVTDPTYVSWQYTLRSSDGHIAQHVEPENVAWHAGNWYVNMHSIGLEHEGFAADGAAWYTEAMYQTSAKLVRYLARKHDIPLDRAHIIGHDQVPSILPANIPLMHWDPGPYWDWEHYFDLLRAPIGGDKDSTRGKNIKRGDVVTVRPGFEGNEQLITDCDGPGTTCEPQGSNFVYLHQAPYASAPLVKDVGLRPDGSESTTQVSDIGPRVAAGQELVVAGKAGPWLGVWYLGDIGWLYSPRFDPAVVKTPGRDQTVSPRGGDEAPVYGRAYPEAEAYEGTDVPVQSVVPLPYTIKPGQRYVLADSSIDTNYYRATTYDGSSPGDWTVVEGDVRYYLIYFGHRMFYVQADDVRVHRR
jgi:N-acetyl-anhydromuramyl-L-alanine amidase AmpD